MRTLSNALLSLLVSSVLYAPFSMAASQQGDSRQLTDLYSQLQQLEREMMDLRGLVEKQAYAIRKLEKQRLEDYQNLDKRIQELNGGGKSATRSTRTPSAVIAPSSAVAASTSTKSPAKPKSTVTSKVSSSGSAKSKPGEREAYQQAFQLLKKQQLKQAELAYQQFLKDYPNGKYSSNAYYWLGELYLTDGNLPRAKATFSSLVQRYPAFRKTPESTYKLAVIYDQMGDKKKAEALLNKVAKDYRQTSPDAAKQANAYLSKHFR